eukprot:3935442-Rhodomonas_salina.2
MGHPAVLPAYGCPMTSAVLTACMVLQTDNILVAPLQWPMPPGYWPPTTTLYIVLALCSTIST